jgi:hypothetical protein
MSQIQIEVTHHQLSTLEELARESGLSVGEYLLEMALLQRSLADQERDMVTLLSSRVEEAQSGSFSDQSVEEIATELFEEMGV